MPKRPPFSRRGEQAIQALQKAALADAMPGPDVGDDVYPTEARLERARAEHYLKPVSPVSVSAGEAITQENIADSPDTHARIIDTLAHPNAISVGASLDRTNAAFGAGVLEPAVDAAASAQASNSIEKMLCHQMAGAHFTAMRLLECAANERLDATDVARLTNAAARMMEVYQQACLVLQKLKTGGAQRVVVQHQQVNVGDGGQAVVAGRIDGGSRGRGTGRKNGRWR